MLAVCNPVSTTSLTSLKKGEHAVVVGLELTSQRERLVIQQRLAELGFIPGEAVHVIAKSFRDRVAVRIGNTIFALRGHEASMIYVNAAS